MILSLLNVMAGISWEPEIRGALVVLIGSTVLFGSVWLILATNMGNRLGTLSAITAFFGWMFIMGVVWWIYGIGLKGDDPVWEPREFVFGSLDEAVTGDVGELANATLVPAPDLVQSYCPGLVDATVEAQRARFVQDDLGVPLNYQPPQPYCDEAIGELLAVDAATIGDTITASNDALDPDDARFLDASSLGQSVDVAVDDQTRKLQQLTLSSLASVAPDLIAQAEDDGVLNFAGWKLLSSAEAGEAVATADAALVADSENAFTGSSDFFVVDAFQKGGKPKRSGDGVVDRVWNEVRNTVIFWHPINTVVIQVAHTLDKPQLEGQAPPFPEIDRDAQVVSVAMVRNLGSRRLPAAIIAMSSLVIFLVLSWMLHTRDLELRRRVDEWDPAAAT